MKIKLYTVAFLFFVCAKSFGGITATIVSPGANATVPNHMYVVVSVTTTYDMQTLTIKAPGISKDLAYNSTSKYFEGVVDISTLPDGDFTLTVVATDVLNNTDSSTSRVLNHQKAYAPVNGVITTPLPNVLNTNGALKVYVKTDQKGYYKANYAQVKINGKSGWDLYDLFPPTKAFSNTLDISGVPQQTLNTLTVYTTDFYGNVDTSSVTFYYDNPPKAQVINNWGSGKVPVVTEPFLHLKAACASDSGHCVVEIINPVTNKAIVQGTNLVDTVIDVTGFAKLGEYGNDIMIRVTDKQGLKDSIVQNYIFEPSPYITRYDGILTPPGSRVTVSDSSYIDYCDDDTCYNRYVGIKVKTPDTTYIINNDWYLHSAAQRQNNDNYLVWKSGLYIYRQNLHTYIVDSFPGLYDNGQKGIVVDTAGNFAYFDSIYIYKYQAGTVNKIASGVSAVVAINGDKVLYAKQNQLRLYNNGIDTLIDDYVEGPTPLIAGGYIGYYKRGNLNQLAIWRCDSAFNKTRITFSYSGAYLDEVNTNGDIVYQTRPYPFTTVFAPKIDDTTAIANIGNYYRINDKPYIISANGGNFSINFHIGPDSLAPIKREVKKDSSVAFAKADFDNAYTGPGHVFKVKITGLPKHGTLFINKVPITLDSVINHASLGGLSYKPNHGYSGKDTIYWTAFNGSVFVANDTIIQLSVVTTLPVQLLNFTGKALGKANLLRWQTAQEVNSSYFGVEKSTDGVQFNSIGNVTAKGNSSITESYEYLDAAPQTGLNYYRLKIVDKDASYGYSQTISIRNSGSYITLVYPNPAKSFVNLSFTAARAGRYSFTMYSANGKAVSTNRYTVATGSQNITLPLSGMASGTYIIKVVDEEGNTVTEQKVVKQ